MLLRVLAALAVLAPVTLAQDAPPSWGEPQKVCDLADREIHESSGLAASRVHEGVFWTHNDSGDRPRLFAIDREGRTRSTVTVEGAEAEDWEDLCAFRWRERACLLVGDVGDNESARDEVVLYLLEEPAGLPAAGTELPVRAALRVRYEDGPHDCEGVAVDATSGTVLLVTKERKGGRPGVYALELVDEAPAEPIVAKRLVHLAAPGMTTALDVSPDGRVAVVLTYLVAYAWTRAEGEGWGEAFARAAAGEGPHAPAGRVDLLRRAGRAHAVADEREAPHAAVAHRLALTNPRRGSRGRSARARASAATRARLARAAPRRARPCRRRAAGTPPSCARWR